MEENDKEEKEPIDIEFTKRKPDHENDENAIDFDGKIVPGEVSITLLKLNWLRA